MKYLIVFALFLLPMTASAQLPGSEEDLAQAIFRFKTGPRGDLRWRECNSYIRGSEAAERARQYANWLYSERESDPDFDPWRAAAVMAQESSFNRCAISVGAWRIIRASFLAEFDREPTESDIGRILRNPRLRERLGVGRFDAGLAQFRWPGAAARSAGLTDPAQLIDARRNIHLTAVAFRQLRAYCSSHAGWRGTYITDSRRVVRYHVLCRDAYWIRHNSPNRFNYRYYYSVNRRYRSLVEFATSTTIEEYNGAT